MKQEVESPWFQYQMATFLKFMGRVCEMEENAKCQDGDDKTPLIFILKLNKLHVLLYFST